MEIAEAGNGRQLRKLLNKIAARPEEISEILEGISRSKNSNMSHIVRPYVKTTRHRSAPPPSWHSG